ncbi:hypothetical protein [Pseudorhodoferax sp. Leaf274]|uniref:hypothetical protein n=1 Tax=Pseudorhodoferax sp. Leaf274 TaxID=1736318 RepID=UPI0007031436|nr:hypothetical protein [Pseudorhodoferax sp. Leaf274]KQP35867.1 hypothetical protein ASF44_21460 [Pseudorhodoferax sp. Leaf274]
MTEDFQINRDAFAMVHCKHAEAKLNEAVARGEWTPEEASQALARFRSSDVLKTLIDLDVERAIAMLEGQVH